MLQDRISLFSNYMPRRKNYLVSELRALQKPTLCLSQTQTNTLLRKQKWEQKGFVAKACELVTSMPVQSEPWSGGPSTRAGLITTSSNFLSVKKEEKVLKPRRPRGDSTFDTSSTHHHHPSCLANPFCYVYRFGLVLWIVEICPSHSQDGCA